MAFELLSPDVTAEPFVICVKDAEVEFSINQKRTVKDDS